MKRNAGNTSFNCLPTKHCKEGLGGDNIKFQIWTQITGQCNWYFHRMVCFYQCTFGPSTVSQLASVSFEIGFILIYNTNRFNQKGNLHSNFQSDRLLKAVKSNPTKCCFNKEKSKPSMIGAIPLSWTIFFLS